MVMSVWFPYTVHIKQKSKLHTIFTNYIKVFYSRENKEMYFFSHDVGPLMCQSVNVLPYIPCAQHTANIQLNRYPGIEI